MPSRGDSGGCFLFFFTKGRIVNYFGTDGSQSAIEFDYRLNGIHNERALIWRESYEKAISITPRAKLGYQRRTNDSGVRMIFHSLFFFLSSPLMTARVSRDERSCLFACFWNLPQLRFSKKRVAFVAVNWLALSTKRNFVFRSIIDTLVRIMTRLATRLRWNLLTDSERRIVIRASTEQIITEALRRFCPRTFKSWQPVKCDRFPLLNMWLTDLFLAQVRELTLIKVSQNLLDLFLESTCVQWFENHQCFLRALPTWSLFPS